jgi:hypothetical protein
MKECLKGLDTMGLVPKNGWRQEPLKKIQQRDLETIIRKEQLSLINHGINDL